MLHEIFSDELSKLADEFDAYFAKQEAKDVKRWKAGDRGPKIVTPDMNKKLESLRQRMGHDVFMNRIKARVAMHKANEAKSSE